MRTYKFKNSLIFAAATSFIIALTLVGCSDSDKAKETAKAPVHEVFNPFDHTKDQPVTQTEKHKFHDQFAAQCVARETKNSVNKAEDTERFTKSCECVTTFMLKDLTDEEVEKYLSEHENPRSLQIKFNSAAYHCAQQQPIEKGFKSFAPPEVKKEEGFFNKFF